MKRRDFLKASAIFGTAFVLSGCTRHENAPLDSSTAENATSSERAIMNPSNRAYDGTFPWHEPYGTGVGAQPGRVVWAFDQESVHWDGQGWWWEPTNFDEALVQKMTDEGIAALAGSENASHGWQTLFEAHNKAKGRAEGYTPGQKLAIKVNINGSGVFGDDDSGETNMDYTNPVVLKCLLRSLMNEAKIAPENITIYDVSRLFPRYMVQLCTEGELSGVRFVGRDAVEADRSAPIQ